MAYSISTLSSLRFGEVSVLGLFCLGIGQLTTPGLGLCPVETHLVDARLAAGTLCQFNLLDFQYFELFDLDCEDLLLDVEQVVGCAVLWRGAFAHLWEVDVAERLSIGS